MNLYLISQDESTGYDTYDSAVVCAPNEETARAIHPSQYVEKGAAWDRHDWATSPENVTVQFIGVAAITINEGVVCASFNAG